MFIQITRLALFLIRTGICVQYLRLLRIAKVANRRLIQTRRTCCFLKTIEPGRYPQWGNVKLREIISNGTKKQANRTRAQITYANKGYKSVLPQTMLGR